MTYLALVDLQNGGFMATGLNTTTLNELKTDLLEYYGSDHPAIDDGEGAVGLDKLQSMTAHELADYGDFAIESSNRPFNEDDTPLEVE